MIFSIVRSIMNVKPHCIFVRIIIKPIDVCFVVVRTNLIQASVEKKIRSICVSQ